VILTLFSFIAVYKASVGSIIETAITGLTPEQQMEVVKGLSKHLVNQGVINSKVSIAQSAIMLPRVTVTDLCLGTRVSWGATETPLNTENGGILSCNGVECVR